MLLDVTTGHEAGLDANPHEDTRKEDRGGESKEFR